MDQPQHSQSAHQGPKHNAQVRNKSDIAYRGPLDTPMVYFAALVLAVALYYADQRHDIVSGLNNRLSFSPSLADVLIGTHSWTQALYGSNLILLCILVTAGVFMLTNMSLKKISAVGDAIASRITKTYTTRISAQEFEKERGDYTQKKIEELVNSQAYKSHMKERNNDLAQSNWQVHQSQTGGRPRYYQQKDFNLKTEIQRVDRDLMAQERFENHLQGNNQDSQQNEGEQRRDDLNQTHIGSTGHKLDFQQEQISSPHKEHKLQSGQGSSLRTTTATKQGQYSTMKTSDQKGAKQGPYGLNNMSVNVSQYNAE